MTSIDVFIAFRTWYVGEQVIFCLSQSACVDVTGYSKTVHEAIENCVDSDTVVLIVEDCLFDSTWSAERELLKKTAVSTIVAVGTIGDVPQGHCSGIDRHFVFPGERELFLEFLHSITAKESAVRGEDQHIHHGGHNHATL